MCMECIRLAIRDGFRLDNVSTCTVQPSEWHSDPLERMAPVCIGRSGYDSSRSFDPIPRDEEENGEREKDMHRPAGALFMDFRTAHWRLGNGVEGADASNKMPPTACKLSSICS